MARYVALLRGINVGGANLIRMADLRACFEAEGFGRVATYIQSGNVLFEAGGASSALTRRIEAMLAAAFDYDASVVLRSARQMKEVVRRAPVGFGARPQEYRCDVVFLKPPLTAAAALKDVSAKQGVDAVHPGPGVLYFSRLARRASQSHLAKLASRPVYARVTVRNWNTTVKLAELMA
jgi:uncharacterized protein (DUF1697 family)